MPGQSHAPRSIFFRPERIKLHVQTLLLLSGQNNSETLFYYIVTCTRRLAFLTELSKIFAVLSIISSVSGLIKAEDVTGNIFVLIDATIDFVLYILYVKFAKQVLVAA